MATPKMTTVGAFIKVLQMHGSEHAFGIIGSDVFHQITPDQIDRMKQRNRELWHRQISRVVIDSICNFIGFQILARWTMDKALIR